MGLENLPGDLMNTLQGAAGSVVGAAQNIKLPEFNLPNPVTGFFQKKDEPRGEAGRGAVLAGKQEKPIERLSTNNAIKVFYYLMAADEQILQGEMEKLDEIGAEIDPEYAQHKESIIFECNTQISKAVNPEDHYAVVLAGVEAVVRQSEATEDSFITPKLLVWDLLMIAYTDGEYDQREKRLIDYIVRLLHVDPAVYLEMESAIQTLTDLEKETKWIKTTNRPYMTIEAHVNELADRKNNIFVGVKDLIRL